MNLASKASIGLLTTVSLVAISLEPAAAAVPTAPRNVAVANASMGSFTIQWQPPASGGPITSYQVNGSSTVAGTATGMCSGGTSDTSCTITGLDNGVPYTFQVTATNGDGTSVPATTAAATALGVPMPPRNLQATPANSAASVTWQEPISNGGSTITSYQVTTTPATTGCTVTGSAGDLGCTLSGLVNGQIYSVAITATNQYGVSAQPSVSPPVTPRTVPDAPVIQSVVHGDASATVDWSQPADGGNPISGYVVTTQPSSGGCSTTGAQTCTVTGMQNGVSYAFFVQAQNDAGLSSKSAQVAAVPSTTADAPVEVQAVPKDSQATVSWSPPVSTGGDPVTSYKVTTNPASSTCTTSALTCDLGSLANGTQYTVSVVATNVNGDSAPSSTTVTPRTVPDAPDSVELIPGNRSIQVKWGTPAFDGGASLTKYTVTTNPVSGGCEAPAGTLECTVTGLQNGVAYQVDVQAVNVAGTGQAISDAATPRTVPNAPIQVAATPGMQSIQVQWTAPTSNGGSPIVNYTVKAQPGNIAVTTAGLSVTLPSLFNGIRYTVTVVATNAAGTSLDSQEVTATPRTVPGIPQGLVVAAGNEQALVSWQPPASDGGSPVTGYVVEVSPGGAGCTTNGALGCLVPGLENGRSYDFRVTAVNVAGSGSPSAETSAMPVTVPTQPRQVAAVGGAGSALVSWQEPQTDGGSPIRHYTVSGAPGGACRTTSTQCLITGLTPGQLYSFTVVATSDVGQGLPSSAASASTWTVPSVPRNVTLTRPGKEARNRGLGMLKVSWVPPVFNGGSMITGYRVTGGGATCTTTGTSCMLTGLRKSQTKVQVVALNALGAGQVSHKAIRARMVTFKRAYSSPTQVRFSGRAARPGQKVELLRNVNQRQHVVATVRAKSDLTWSVTVNVPWHSARWRARSQGYKTGILTNGWSW